VVDAWPEARLKTRSEVMSSHSYVGRRGPRRALVVVSSLALSTLVACTASDLEDADEEVTVREDKEQALPDIGATSVSIQRLQKPTEFADTRILVTLAKEQSKELEDPQVIGAGDEKSPILLRDDGQGGDEIAGDLVFTGLAFADLEGLKARAEAESQDKVGEVAVFSGRSVDKFVDGESFDFAAFLGGKLVKLPGVPRLLFSLPRAQRNLMITDPSVVRDLTRTYDPCSGKGDPFGPWSFGHLMTEMANQPLTGIDPADFVEDWLQRWLSPQLPGSASVVVPPRPAMQQIIDDWRAASGGGPLDLAKAPFRLLAIVNRIDLARRTRGGGGYGGGLGGDFLDGGEGRFVFGLVLPSGYQTKGYNNIGVLDSKTSCRLTPFTVIMEYKIDRRGCLKVRDWAQQWQALQSMAFGAGYNAALQAITDQFTTAGVSPGRGNDSALGQLRTNDFLLAAPWQMRENQIEVPTGFLEPHQVADTVELMFNNTNTLGGFINAAGMTLPPQSFPWAGASDVPGLGLFWDGAHAVLNTLAIVAGAANDSNDFRHNFSLGACSGCHARETDARFTHVDNRTPLGRTQEAILSEFVLGEKVNPTADNLVTGNLHKVDDPSITPRGGVINPANPQHVRGFRDLQRRQQVLQDFATQSCFRVHPMDPVMLQDTLQFKKLPPDDVFKDVQPLKGEQLPSLSLERLGDVPTSQVH
jgi:hypothetical protein